MCIIYIALNSYSSIKIGHHIEKDLYCDIFNMCRHYLKAIYIKHAKHFQNGFILYAVNLYTLRCEGAWTQKKAIFYARSDLLCRFPKETRGKKTL